MINENRKSIFSKPESSGDASQNHDSKKWFPKETKLPFGVALVILLVLGYVIYGMFAYDRTLKPGRETSELIQEALNELLLNGATFEEARAIITEKAGNHEGELEKFNEELRDIIDNPKNYISR